jgi:hypothetical protein
MSAAAQTKIFGLRLRVDPKILVGGLVAIAVLLFWYNSQSDDETSTRPTTINHISTAPSAVPLRAHPTVRRDVRTSADRSNTLRMRPIDATRGDVDPTLRLDLLARLQAVKAEEGGRNLFEVGPAPAAPADTLVSHSPILPPKPLEAAAANAAPGLDIPLQYYGFVKDGEKGDSRRGLFLDGDNILVASEGELLKQRYLVVELTPINARMEDVQVKQGKMLPVVPVAVQQ